MKNLIFIVFMGWFLVLGGCRTQSVAPSFITKDSIVHDSVIISDTVYWIDPLFIESLFKCDSTGQVHLAEIANISAKFDSLKKISPLVRTVFKIKKETLKTTQKEYVVCKPIVVYKIHALSYVIAGIAILVIILCILVVIYMLKYKK